ncbi:MAG TPA: M48 family peptidase [Campylobacterales bacterium]|nr:M48 family peptidase [Campylobacterales bacterium]
MKIYKKVLLSIVIFTFVACTSSPYTNRSQLIMVSPSQEMQLGYNAEQQLLRKSNINHNRALNERVRRVGTNIARVANQPNYRWKFHVVNGKQINAFCLPGGKIFVYTGLLNLVDNDSQLATVMAHEVAHAIARHGAERMSMMQLGQIGKQLATKAAGPKYTNAINQIYGIGANYGLFLPYSRTFEYEADEIGLYLMSKAGYDPRQSVAFWQKMMQASRSMRKPPEFASTHPSDINRIRRLQALIPRALKYYR